MIKYLTKKPSYVCCTCSQDFTRKYNANRHNQNIHFGKAEIVRYFEYLIGRGSGKYLPADPLSYRNKKRNKDKLLLSFMKTMIILISIMKNLTHHP